MEGTAESQTPDLRDVEGKVGRKTPEGLLRGLRGEWEPGTSGALLLSGAPSTGHSLGDKIMALRMELVSGGCSGQWDGVSSAGPERMDSRTQSWAGEEGVKTTCLTPQYSYQINL